MGRSPSPAVSVPSPVAAVVVAVAGHDLPAHASLTADDLRSVRLSGLGSADALLRDAGSAQGRRLIVALRAGTPIPLSALEPGGGTMPDRRLLTVRVERDRLAADVVAGATVDVVASVQPAGSGAGETGRVVNVATARVVALAPATASGVGNTPPADGAVGDAASSSALAVTLECAAADTLRLAWAEDFSRGLRLIADAGGTPLQPAADGPAIRP